MATIPTKKETYIFEVKSTLITAFQLLSMTANFSLIIKNNLNQIKLKSLIFFKFG